MATKLRSKAVSKMRPLILEEAWQTVRGRGRTYRVKLSDPEIE